MKVPTFNHPTPGPAGISTVSPMKRNPLLHWVIALATLGQYAFIWMFLLARDVNRLAGARWKRVRPGCS